MREKNEEQSGMSKNILYSTNVYGKDENVSNPKIILLPLNWENSKESKNMSLLLLKYKESNGINSEVVMAILESTYNRKQKLKTTIELMENQLRSNAKEEDGYNYYKELRKYMKNEDIPLKFTMEGLEILSTKSKKEIQIERTFGINENIKVEVLISDTELEKMRKTKIPEVVKQELWEEGRNAILKSFKTEREKKAFLKGEQIAKIMQSTEITDNDTEEIIEAKQKNQRKVVANYLLGIYDKQNTNEKKEYQEIEDKFQELRRKVENSINSKPTDKRMRDTLEILRKNLEFIDKKNKIDSQNTKQQNDEELVLLREYLSIKEKGLAIDANIALENIEIDINQKIADEIDEKGEVPLEDNKYAKLLQSGHHFFDLVKKGIDRTARIYALTTGNVDFELLKKLIEKKNGKDQELLKYIELKEKILEQIQTENIQDKEQEYPVIRELYEFLLNSSIREMTKKDDEDMFLRIFEKAKEELLKNNADEINLYNNNAKPFKIYLCPTYAKEKDDTNKGFYNIHRYADKLIEKSEINSYLAEPEDSDSGSR